ncbi:deaminase domain-containing protein [Paludibacterium paludis]|uniref:Uncharacterized protein n=1 Tax=Paludibacterium paludis TaxID=1225769 RepID=A0A918P270_9NEIS|nr:deaminase domain-containing protein [Paludibacterium paludis]GGY14071.1 hypothetical protein GCM10011289_16780 [Paludibacterium paludis]
MPTRSHHTRHFLAAGGLAFATELNRLYRARWALTASRRQLHTPGCFASAIYRIESAERRGFAFVKSHSRPVNGASRRFVDGLWQLNGTGAAQPPWIRYPATFAANRQGKCYLRTSDAEYLIVNHLAVIIADEFAGRAAGTLALAIEYPPCASCRKVIDRLRKAHPALLISVQWPRYRSHKRISRNTVRRSLKRR